MKRDLRAATGASPACSAAAAAMDETVHSTAARLAAIREWTADVG